MTIPKLKPNADDQTIARDSIEFMDVTGRYEFREYLGPDPDLARISEALDQVLIQSLAARPDQSNGELYEDVCVRLCGREPMQRQPLLLFMASFAEALQRQLFKIATTCSQQPSVQTPDAPSAKGPTNPRGFALADTQKDREFKPGMSTSLAFAMLFPAFTIHRLNRLKVYREEYQLNAHAYELYDFIECTALEISQLLDIAMDKTAGRLGAACAEIRAEEPTTTQAC